MTTTRVLVLEAPRRLVARALPLPEIGDDDGLLRVGACGPCGADHERYIGTLPAGFAFVPGHESMRIIESVGRRAAARWGVRVGDRVARGVPVVRHVPAELRRRLPALLGALGVDAPAYRAALERDERPPVHAVRTP